MRTFFDEVARAVPADDDLLLVGDGEVVDHFADHLRAEDERHGHHHRRMARWYDHPVPRFVFVDGPRNGVVDFRNLLPGEIPVGDSFYRLTNRTRNDIVEYLWQQPVTAPPPQPKKKRERKRATKPKI